jgi:hypothetical protein
VVGLDEPCEVWCLLRSVVDMFLIVGENLKGMMMMMMMVVMWM